jgi:excisionase family DNA binding protein
MSAASNHPAKRPIAETVEDDSLEPISVRIATAVKLTGIGRSTLYELIGSGEIETVKIGRSTLIPYRSLKRLILR